jgi:predicted PurR-regulated permease PerM
MRDRVVKLESEPRSGEPPIDTRLTTDAALTIRHTGLTLIALLAVVLVLQYLQAIIIPIVLGILVSYALEPIVAWMVRWRIPRVVAAGALLLTLVAAGGWLVYSLRGQATEIVDRLPQAAQQLRRILERRQPDTGNAINQVQRAANELEKAAAAAASPPPPPSGVTRVQVESPRFNVGAYVLWGSLGAVAVLGQLLLVLLLVFFLLASGDLYRRKLVRIAGPSLSQKRITVEILADVNRQIESFLLVQLFTSTLVGVVSWLAFRAFGLEQAALWGLMAGIFNSIPYLGPIVVTGGTAVAGFIQFGNVRMALLVAGTSLVITSLEGFLLTPWLGSRAARMNAVAVFVGLIFWGALWNVWGMLLAVPMMMVLKAVCDHVEDFKPVSELLGD